ncbi:MAG TPA: hypothetical protein VI251_14565 [Pseudolabrys sp.]
MRRATIIVTAATLVLAGFIVKGLVAPGHSAAATDATNGSIQAAVPVYDLHVHHPHMKTLSVQDAPLP